MPRHERYAISLAPRTCVIYHDNPREAILVFLKYYLQRNFMPHPDMPIVCKTVGQPRICVPVGHFLMRNEFGRVKLQDPLPTLAEPEWVEMPDVARPRKPVTAAQHDDDDEFVFGVSGGYVLHPSREEAALNDRLLLERLQEVRKQRGDVPMDHPYQFGVQLWHVPQSAQFECA